MSKKIKVLLIVVLISALLVYIIHLLIKVFKTYKYVNDFTNSVYVMGIDTYPSLFESKKTILYYEVNDRNNARKVKKFIPDNTNIYTSENCIDGNVINIDLSRCHIKKNNEEIEKTSEIVEIYKSLGKSTERHWIIENEFKIFEINDEYYVFAPLNVNMHTPVYFFKYNDESKELKFLYQLENINVVGIKVKKS